MKVILNGISQEIALEGKEDSNIMIMFHGGLWGPVIYGQCSDQAGRNKYV